MGVAASTRRLAKCEIAERHIDRALYITPSDASVARLYRSHGIEACTNRWWWIQGRVLLAAARRAMLADGAVIHSINRRRSTPPDLEAAAVEAAYVLGSAHAAERASGISSGALICILARRGLRVPAGLSHLRGLHALQRRQANAGDRAAADAIEAREAHERDVVQVLRCALALVPDQPAAGRYVLPEPGPALDAAVAGLPAAAVSAVFPKPRA